MLLRPLLSSLHHTPRLIPRLIAKPQITSRFTYSFDRKMSSTAPADAAAPAQPKVAGEQPNLQLDKETGEMVSKS